MYTLDVYVLYNKKMAQVHMYAVHTEPRDVVTDACVHILIRNMKCLISVDLEVHNIQ